MVQTVCAWDVGIKNLAYCVMEKRDDGTFNVDKNKWNKINLMDDENKVKLKCTHITINGKKEKPCTKDAKSYYIKDDIKYGLCTIHKKNYTAVQENINVEEDFASIQYDKKSDKVPCEYLGKEDKLCGTKSLWKHDGKSLCSAHKKTTINNLKKANSVKTDKKQNCMHVNLFILGQKLYSELNKIKEVIMNVDEVIIENQPTFINPTMKTMSALIYGYFVMVLASEKGKYPLHNVKFYAPSNKLKIKTTDDKINIKTDKKSNKSDKELITDKIKTKTKEAGGTAYKLTKDTAVKYCKYLLKDKKEMVDYIDSFTKKDDLSDAFLHGYHYLFGKAASIDSATLKELGFDSI